MSTAIAIRGLTKTFPGAGGERRGTPAAVDGVSIDIAPGELFFLLGPSGCGKTTLLRMLAGFIEPTAGTIAFDGRDVTHTPPAKRNTAMVFQSYALWPHMTVEANVAFGLSVRKVAREERARRVREALESVRMAEYAARRPNQLSGGQQQRVALARALIVRPAVLLLDEPLSNLDARLRLELRGEIRRICKDAGLTTVYVTHDQKEALSMADRVAIMRAGRIVQAGTPRDLYRRPASRFVAEFLGETTFLAAGVTGVREGPRGPAAGGAGRVLLDLATPVGPLVAASDAPGPGVGERVTCSIRPEAVRVEPGPVRGGAGATAANAIRARVVETTYLGESALVLLDAGGTPLRASIPNPSDLPGAGEEVGVSASPEDVAVLREG